MVMATIETNNLLSTAEAAILLGERVDTLQKYCQRNVIVGAIKLGSSWLIPKESIDEFKQKRRGRGRPKKLA